MAFIPHCLTVTKGRSDAVIVAQQYPYDQNDWSSMATRTKTNEQSQPLCFNRGCGECCGVKPLNNEDRYTSVPLLTQLSGDKQTSLPSWQPVDHDYRNLVHRIASKSQGEPNFLKTIVQTPSPVRIVHTAITKGSFVCKLSWGKACILFQNVRVLNSQSCCKGVSPNSLKRIVNSRLDTTDRMSLTHMV
jgi:hypothetical protein